VILIILAAIIIALAEGVPLIKKRLWRELGIFFCLILLAVFIPVAFRKKIYTTLEELQTDVDLWIKSYNEERPHSGRHCDGKTPMETFLQSKHLAQDKMLGNDLAA